MDSEMDRVDGDRDVEWRFWGGVLFFCSRRMGREGLAGGLAGMVMKEE